MTLRKTAVKKHDCGRWTYHGGMATCAHGYELLPDGTTRRPPHAKWKAHRAKIPRVVKVHLRDVADEHSKSGIQEPHQRFLESENAACLTCARICGCDECNVLRRDWGKFRWKES